METKEMERYEAWQEMYSSIGYKLYAHEYCKDIWALNEIQGC